MAERGIFATLSKRWAPAGMVVIGKWIFQVVVRKQYATAVRDVEYSNTEVVVVGKSGGVVDEGRKRHTRVRDLCRSGLYETQYENVQGHF